jgi:hypothetical protein
LQIVAGKATDVQEITNDLSTSATPIRLPTSLAEDAAGEL